MINLTKFCSLLATFFNIRTTFQCCLNVVVRVIWRCDVRQCQIKVETTLCMSTLKFTTFNSVELTLSIDQRRSNIVNMIFYINFKKLKRTNIFELQKKKMTHLINNTCFRLQLIKKKGKHGTYNIKINVGKYNAWCMKRVWK